MARSSRSSSPSFDITESAYRQPKTDSTLFQYDGTGHGGDGFTEQRHEQSESYGNDDEDSVEMERLVSGKHISAHTREVGADFDIYGRQTLKELLSAYWTFEVVCCGLSFALLAVIAVILAVFNGRAVPDWPFGITLGALLAVIAVIMTFGLTIPVGAALAQMKWLWYRSERSVADFGVIDEASRNAWGSLKMLVKRKAGFIGALGAVLMILTLPIAPFVQQTVQYDTLLVNSTSTAASLPVVVRSHPDITDGAIGNTDVDLALKGAFMNGLLNYQAELSTFNVPVSCTTGICGWLPYQSLAVSGQCEDLTSELTTELRTNETFPDGYNNMWLASGLELDVEVSQYGLPAMILKSSEGPHDPLVLFETITAPLTTGETADGEQDGAAPTTIGPFAARCTLSLVIQSYTGFMSNGIFTESLGSTSGPLSPSSMPMQWDAATDTWTGDGIPPLTPPMTFNDTFPYGMDLTLLQAMQTYLQAELNGSFQSSNTSAVPLLPGNALHAIFHALTSTEPHTLDAMLTSIAASMTRGIRTAPGTAIPVTGTTWASVSVVHVEWAWLALPGAVALLVLMYVALVGLASRRAGLREPWKGSATAVLFHGLDLARDEESWRRVRRAVTVREMDEAALGLHVALQRHENEDETKGDEGWGLRRVVV